MFVGISDLLFFHRSRCSILYLRRGHRSQLLFGCLFSFGFTRLADRLHLLVQITLNIRHFDHNGPDSRIAGECQLIITRICVKGHLDSAIRRWIIPDVGNLQSHRRVYKNKNRLSLADMQRQNSAQSDLFLFSDHNGFGWPVGYDIHRIGNDFRLRHIRILPRPLWGFLIWRFRLYLFRRRRGSHLRNHGFLRMGRLLPFMGYLLFRCRNF